MLCVLGKSGCVRVILGVHCEKGTDGTDISNAVKRCGAVNELKENLIKCIGNISKALRTSLLQLPYSSVVVYSADFF